jgi:hypothetical protein
MSEANLGVHAVVDERGRCKRCVLDFRAPSRAVQLRA